MDGKDLISPSDLPPFYGQQQQQQQHLRMLGGTGGGGGQHSPSSLAGMHSVIRPMPNMSMSPTAILQSIGGGASSLAGMQFNMDNTTSPSSMLQHAGNMGGSVSGSGTTMPVASPPPEPVKRKRGRPRKYGPDGAMKHHMSSSSSSAHHQQQQHQMMVAPQQRMGSMAGQGMAGGLDDAAQKKKRGRPPGTGKKLSSPSSKPSGNAFPGSAGTSFTPHIITASPSEDVAGKIAAFANQSPRAVCVLSAMGSVSRAVLRHPADHPPSYNNPAIYEGLYEILSLSGSYNLNEGQQNQTDGISVTLCSPERHVIGGVLGGALVAASTVQVVLGTFVQGGSKSKSKKAAKPPAFGPDSLTGAGPDVVSPSSGHNQNLTSPPSVVSTGGWPSSGIFDTRSSNIDINSSRG
ncbi:AT-hook motif nuclear-localized protein 9-like [Triticum dicoccoides]|uniref:AT-hook motif nuclear-localized protein 9-like n=1 Tax=Triticum dicoccoides TaxID=85692 RepID=UPI00188DF3D2|nr:AT-hook motif nuclear-localized protein 9-like [Triticum dicoccoides]